MLKKILVLVVLTHFWILNASAQKNKSDKNDLQLAQLSQVSLEQRLGELSKEISDELTGNQKTTVAIADFVDLNGRT